MKQWKLLLWALLFTLIFPLYYSHCFDSCQYAIWPFLIPGLQWFGFADNLLVLLHYFLIFYLIFFIAGLILRDKLRNAFVLVIGLFTGFLLLAFWTYTSLPQKYFDFIELKVGTFLYEFDLERSTAQTAKECQKYSLEMSIDDVKVKSFEEFENFVRIGFSSAYSEYYLTGFPDKTSGNSLYGLTMSGELLNVLKSKDLIISNSWDTASRLSDKNLIFDSCLYKNRVILCFSENRIVLKACEDGALEIDSDAI